MNQVAEQPTGNGLDIRNEYNADPIVFGKEERARYSVEVGEDGADFILHFYRQAGDSDAFWMQVFPDALEKVAMSHFNASAPKLKAAYESAVDSWWLRAFDYSTVLDRSRYIQSFLRKLDAAIAA